VVIALNKDASGKVWEFPPAPRIDSVLSGVAVANGANGVNGVVYFQTSGQPFSFLYALNAETGVLLAQAPTLKRPHQFYAAISGPSVSNGQVYVGAGIFFATKGQANSQHGIVAFGLVNDGR
jgi:outer membrane protein assembly factor BamB